jgi:hypothetical protein
MRRLVIRPWDGGGRFFRIFSASATLTLTALVPSSIAKRTASDRVNVDCSALTFAAPSSNHFFCPGGHLKIHPWRSSPEASFSVISS